MDADQPTIMKASAHISVDHILQLATGYLGFSKPEIDNISRDGLFSQQIIFDCLLTYCQRKSCKIEELSDVLENAGKEEGLISRVVIDILRGNNSVYHTKEESENILCKPETF